MDQNQTAADSTNNKQINLQRLYVKEQQCKLPRGLQIFKDEWQPEINMEIQINNAAIEKDVYEAVLQITITAKNKQMTALTAEVSQAGVFQIQGFTEAEQKMLFATYIPNILFPYARQVVSSLTVDATIPPIILTPVNFDALYQQGQAKQQEQEQQTLAKNEAATIN